MTDHYRIRLAWKHVMFDGKVQEGQGYAYLDTEKRRRTLLSTVEFANAHHGKGTHWIERVSDDN
jgi:hypothetical protein